MKKLLAKLQKNIDSDDVFFVSVFAFIVAFAVCGVFMFIDMWAIVQSMPH